MVPNPVRIVHITDTHISGKPGAKVYGIDSFEALRSVITAVHQSPQRSYLMIATGDLSQDGTEESYSRIRDLLAPLSLPVYCLAGNHDLCSAMGTHLQGEGIRIERRVILDRWQIIFLDSHLPGKAFGYLSSEELAELEFALRELPNHYALVGLHHGPLAVCSMPACRLENADELMTLLRRRPNVRGIISGHNHCAIDELCDGIRMLVTPSTCVQMSHPSEMHDERAFWDVHVLDRRRQGFRQLELHSDGHISSEVIWISAERFP
jgi:3',5'-cyclic-AMP phosphodiesterase